MNLALRGIVAGFVVSLVVSLGGCQSAPKARDYTPTVARFFLESASGDGNG